MSFWKRYYYSYLASFVGFLVPPGAHTFVIDQHMVTKGGRVALVARGYDYIVVSDTLGHINDIQAFFREAKKSIRDDGRLVITQYNALWEPVIRIASYLGLRQKNIEQNWLSLLDLRTFTHLAGLEVVKSGTKMLMPIYIPFISHILNRYIANMWPFNRLGLFHYVVVRKPEPRNVVGSTSWIPNPSFSIIIAARNEAGTIEKIVKELPEVGAFTEIIFVEGNSTDNTYEEIERVARAYGTKRKISFAKQDGKGKGDAVRKGFDMATGDILAIYDADMTVPPEEMSKFFDAIAENKGDFINGSRLVYPLEKDSMRVLNFFGNKFFSLAFSWILSQSLKDTLCGTKVIWREDYEKVKKGRTFFGDFDPFGDFDLLFGAAKLNLKIIDLPIHYKERIYGMTNISRWKHGWLLLRMTIFAARKIKFI